MKQMMNEYAMHSGIARAKKIFKKDLPTSKCIVHEFHIGVVVT